MRDEFELAPVDRLGDPETLRKQADEAKADLGADLRPGAAQTGADPAGCVRVRMNPAGDVVDVTVDRQWSRRLGPDELGAAVLVAYQQATLKRAVAIAAASVPAAAEPVEGRATGRYDPGMPDIDDEHWLDWVWASLSESRRRLDDLDLRRAAAPPEVFVEGPAGLVRLRVTGRTITAVLIDAVSTAERSPGLVAADLSAAFADVRRRTL